MSRQTWVLLRMRREPACQPEVWAKLRRSRWTTGLQSRHGEAWIAGLSREFAMWWQCSDISEIWAWEPELKIRHIVAQRDRADSPRFHTREQIEQVLGYCNRFSIISNCRLTALRITELVELKANEYQRQDDCIYRVRVANGGGAYESEKLAKDWRSDR